MDRGRPVRIVPCICGLVICLVLTTGCGGPARQDRDGQSDLPLPPISGAGQTVIFTEVAQAAGINFRHSFGDAELSNLVEAVGSGALFLDFNSDGWLDLFVASGTATAGISDGGPEPHLNRLYKNLGDGRFSDVTTSTGLAGSPAFNTGVASADFDADGDPDLFVCGFGRSQLYRNDGDSFVDISDRAAVANEDLFAAAAVFFDVDHDGWLDLFVTNYVDYDSAVGDGNDSTYPGPLAYPGQSDRLYRNLGDGTFADVSASYGLDQLAGRGMSATTIDIDGDGWLDLYVTNDGSENFLYRNLEGQALVDIALITGIAYNGMGDATASMGVSVGDVDLDGLLDIYVSDDARGSLYLARGQSQYSDSAVSSGITSAGAQLVTWGSLLFDHDNDGDLDIFKVNSDLFRLTGQHDQLLDNTGSGRFIDASDMRGDYFKRTVTGRSACSGDYDNDGDLDVVVVNLNDQLSLLRNDGGNRGNWLLIELVGRPPNRDAIGAEVTVRTATASIRLQRSSTSGYLSQNDPRLHVGLGSETVAKQIDIVWPSGEVQTLMNVTANQVLRIEQ